MIQEHDWSQVLVFTRTKFGVNHVAEYLGKHGITPMARVLYQYVMMLLNGGRTAEERAADEAAEAKRGNGDAPAPAPTADAGEPAAS